VNSKKLNFFALTEFSEVRVGGILGNRAFGILGMWIMALAILGN